VLDADHTYGTLTDKIASITLRRRTSAGWFLAFAITGSLVALLLVSIFFLFAAGIGIWGLNVPVAWGFAIVNFVWWIGIGHAGTLISAILLLFRQEWRTSINRFAEAMTLFAVVCAGIFPLIHLGRAWLFYWLIPYPNTMGIWPQFQSPLVWDLFAVGTYATVSLLFWYVGLIPDLATLRDRATHRFPRIAYGLFAMGWRGSARHWHRYEVGYKILAGIATPLVVSVHTVVSFDFAVSIVPGWHITIFPPYFVAGAIFSGFAMVITLAVPLRRIYSLHDLITERHLNNMGKILLGTGLIVAYGYLMEHFFAWYGGNRYDEAVMHHRESAEYAPLFWAQMVCNVLVPQVLWLRRVRTSPVLLFIVALFVNVGMWLERFIIVVTSLYRDYLPSSWEIYTPTIWDWTTYIGTIGLFLFLIVLFVRFVPMISIFEMRELITRRGDPAGGAERAERTPSREVEP